MQEDILAQLVFCNELLYMQAKLWTVSNHVTWVAADFVCLTLAIRLLHCKFN